MQVNLMTTTGKQSSKKTDLVDAVFACDFNQPLVHQIVTAYLAGARRGTRAQKTRSEVRGGGTKPWRQKGTGKARAGSIRSPIWKGGGTTFAAKPQDYSQKVNKKMYRSGMRSILSELVRQERLKIIDKFAVDAAKTKELIGKLKQLDLTNVLIITQELDENLMLASRNVPNTAVIPAKAVDPVNLLRYEHVLATTAAMKQLEEMFT